MAGAHLAAGRLTDAHIAVLAARDQMLLVTTRLIADDDRGTAGF